MSEEHSITILHLSDMQFGIHHRFGVELQSPDDAVDTLLERLKDDLRVLQKDYDLHPELLILTGDLAEWGKKKEFQDVFTFVDGLAKFLNLTRARVVLIPGNHDINRKSCEAYFNECEADDEQPRPPFWSKWKQFVDFFDEFYKDQPGIQFTEDQPWTLFEIPELKVVIAGLNSTIKESHRDEDHYGWIGESQLKRFANHLERFRQDGWLRIGAVHHNVQRRAQADDENLRDADDLERILGNSLNLVLHGHTHEGKLAWLNQKVPILATGSTAVKTQARPIEVPNQYQVIRIWRNRIRR